MKKGFTLIELLAVIVILAVISLIAVPRIMDAIDESRAGALRQNNEAVIKAAQNYFVDNAIDLPQTVGETAEISLEQLIQNDLINEISSPYSSNSCSGYVLVTKVSGGHNFVPHINCFESVNDSNEDGLIAHFDFKNAIVPTENLFKDHELNNPVFDAPWPRFNFSFLVPESEITILRNQEITGVTKNKAVRITGDSDDSIRLSFGHYEDEASSFSGYFKNYGDSNLNVFLRRMSNENQSASVTYRVEPGETKFVTHETKSGDAGHRYLRLTTGSPEFDFAFYNLQFETMPHVTSFTSDVREDGFVYDFSKANNKEILQIDRSPTFLNKTGRKAAFFNGNINNAEINMSRVLPGDMTLSLWFNASKNDTARMLYSQADSNQSRRQLYIAESNTIIFNSRIHNDQGSPAAHPAVYINRNLWEENVWNHVVATQSGNDLKIYLNGELIDSNTFENGLKHNFGNNMSIGSTVGANSHKFLGYMSDIRINNRALSNDEVKQLYFQSR